MSITSKSFLMHLCNQPLLSKADAVQPLDLTYVTIILPFLEFHVHGTVEYIAF